MKVAKKRNSTSKTRGSSHNGANGRSTASSAGHYSTGVTKKRKVSKGNAKKKSVGKKSKTRASKGAAGKRKQGSAFDYEVAGSEHGEMEVHSMEPRFETTSQSSSKSKPVLTKIKGKE